VILVDEKAKHLQSCSLASVTCDLCQSTYLRQDAETHISQNVISHLSFLTEQLKQTQSKVTSLEREVEEARNKVKELEQNSVRLSFLFWLSSLWVSFGFVCVVFLLL
jgi:TolA-binding protein